MTGECSESVKIAKEYYNSNDADEFYYRIWGGEDIHIGLYLNESGSIHEASKQTVVRMCSLLTGITPNSKILDIGSGYGGAARHLATHFGCQVTCLNLSEKENERNRKKNEEAKLEHLIQVYEGNFENLPFDNSAFDLVWSEDAILHSGAKSQVFQEVHRVLADEGEFIFTDPMQNDTCPNGVLKPVLERIHLDAFGSFQFYQDISESAGFKKLQFVDLSEHLATHYFRVRQELEKRYDGIMQFCDKTYIDRMITGLNHWIEAGRKGYLTWGILHFKKL